MLIIEKDQVWDYAFGLLKIDGLEPSEEFLEWVEEEKRGEITKDDILERLNKEYNVQ